MENSFPAPLQGTVAIDTHGCKLNQADSNLLARRFLEAGYRLVDSVAEADVYVLNTCTVTATADAKARQALNSARRINSNAMIVAAGCYPQRASQELARMKAVSLVVPNTDKEELVSLVTAARQQAPLHPPLLEEEGLTEVSGPEEGPVRASQLVNLAPRTERSRAMVKIQEGCNQVCAYCIVPRVRGRERSIPPEALIEQINRYEEEGSQEVILTGTQLGTYGFDIPGASLPELLRRILKGSSMPRIRVSSLQPQEIGPELLELWANRRLCPHFHIPLQSGSDRVLKSMRRRYDTRQFAASVDLVRQAIPDVGITTDLIVGFPGETDAEFRESRDFARSMSFSDMHIFPYSQRPGTTAAHLGGQVPGHVKRGRVTEMMEVARQGFHRFRERQLATTRPVLWESQKERHGVLVWSGLTDNYIRVYIDETRELRNLITPACLSTLEGDGVYAIPA